MCGIAGLISFNEGFLVSEESLKRFSECLKYRGPDHEGYLNKQYNNAFLSFAHRRLKIIDLTDAGNQPMLSHSGRTLINYNGEIFNFIELRDELLKEGYSFKSNCDTEVIINAYEAWGLEKTLDIMDGMFAFVLYDISENKLILARDRFGKKPLYYYRKGNQLAFSSDIRSFHVYPGNLSLNYYSLEYYFQELTTPRSHSVFKNIEKVEAACYYIFSNNGFEKKCYWQLNFTHNTKHNLKEIINHSDYLLNNAVKKRLIADVTLGIFLSGGVDSGLVTAMASLNSPKPIKTFSVGFTYKPYSELEYASIIAKKYNTEHHEIIITPSDINIIDRLIEEFGEPFADSSMIPTYYVSHFASKTVKTVLSGDGGDELFGGYSTYKVIFYLEKLLKLSFSSPFFRLLSKVIISRRFKLLTKLLSNPLYAKVNVLFRQMGFDDEEMKNLFSQNSEMLGALEFEHLLVFTESWGLCKDDFSRIQYSIIKNRLINDYLVKVDRASMYNSLEVRLPFLDKDLMSYVATLKKNQILHNGNLKYISKKIAEKYLPLGTIYRDKWGFSIPIEKWFREELRNHAKEVILDSRNFFPGLNLTFVEKIMNEHQNGVDHSNKLWALYVLHKWMDLNKPLLQTQNNTITVNKNLKNQTEIVSSDNVIRVAQIVPTLEMAGAEKVALTLALELNKRPGFKCCIVIFKPINEFQSLSKDLDVFVCPSELNHFILKRSKVNLFHFINFVKDWQPDIIHSHLVEAEIITRFFVFPRIKYVSHFHNNHFLFDNLNYKGILNKTCIANSIVKSRIQKNYINCSNTFISISDENHFFIKENLNPPIGKLIKLYNAVDLKRFHIKQFTELHKPFRLVNIGRMHARKNQIFLISMAKELLKRNIDFHLTIIGQGELFEEIEKEIVLNNLEKKITLFGLTENPENILRENDLYVHPAILETHPLVILEAMACGLPCIGFNVMGVKEVIKHGKNGFLSKTNDLLNFCDYLETLLKNRSLFEEMYNYLKIFREQFSQDKWVDRITEIYTQNT
ncbi:MAG: asparagine synthase (glutamine-hydrolyzing) [Bacteroidetes bacterium RIFCSPLOWO2_02_FULL_36_8]|nr:MAG: asparagine synthase (glutamine-hydrolyzing) [Bacteroidetes bacterium RIFCSPLOWO2_02_FULL_36_8]